jgi:hypothetical protein
MNASDILKYGHLWVMKHVEGLPEPDWEQPGVCGVWSVKEIVAHLASFEQALVEVLKVFSGNEPGPVLTLFKEVDGDRFNALQVEQRKSLTPGEILSEYTQLQADTMSLIVQIPESDLRQPGKLPWYGMEYALDDFIVYSFYGHKREHMAQVAVFRDRIGR